MTRVLACLAIWSLGFPALAFSYYDVYGHVHGLRHPSGIPQAAPENVSSSWAMTTYTVGLAAITILPIATVVSLVTPQAVAGLKILDGLRDSGWIRSPEAQAWFASVDAWLKNLPGLEGGLDQALPVPRRALPGTAARTVLAGGVGIAGGAFQAVLGAVHTLS